ncbi:hypothetical protein D3C87_1354260 [compost metagenome]
MRAQKVRTGQSRKVCSDQVVAYAPQTPSADRLAPQQFQQVEKARVSWGRRRQRAIQAGIVEAQEQGRGVDAPSQRRHVLATQLIEAGAQTSASISLADLYFQVPASRQGARCSGELSGEFHLATLTLTFFAQFRSGPHGVRVRPQRKPFGAMTYLPLFVALENGGTDVAFGHQFLLLHRAV